MLWTPLKINDLRFACQWTFFIALHISTRALDYNELEKQPYRCVLRKRCSEKMQQIYWRTPMPKCDFNKFQSNFTEITLRHGCSPVNLLHIFRTPFPKNTSRGLLLELLSRLQYSGHFLILFRNLREGIVTWFSVLTIIKLLRFYESFSYGNR